MSKRTRQKRTTSQKVLWALSLIIVGSMVISLILVALPQPAPPTPTPWPTLTPRPASTATAVPAELPPSPAPEPTETAEGPLPATNTPAVTPPVSETPTLTPTTVLTIAPPTVTPSAANGSFTFSVAGDSRGNPKVYGRVLKAVASDGSEFLVHTGDLVNKGTQSQWADFEGAMAGFTLPFYPVPGNHDGLNGKLDGYLTSSGAPAAHYSFDRMPVHFTLADSHHGGITAKELEWLRADLGATIQPLKMVVLHHPPFDPDGTDHIMAFGNDRFMDLMVEQGVDYVFAGHIHAFAQEERDGVVYTITGGAGAPLYGGDHPEAYHHYLRVTVEGQDVIIEVVKI